ncbi:MAG: PEP-CTERM sorting domain-containing protein [Roseibacillus sp.]
MKLTLTLIPLLPLIAAPLASAALIVDFTSAGNQTAVISGGTFVFSSEEVGTPTGVSFDVTASAVIPAGGGAFGGDIFQYNGGLGSDVENSGGFVNVIGGVSEVLEFTISNVSGLQPGESLVIVALLSQNGSASNANQGGGYGGTFGENANDNITLTSDSLATVGIPQSDAGNVGAIWLNTEHTNAATGNTFTHSAGGLGFTNSFTLSQTNLTRNDAVVIQGFEFAVVPEPSTFGLLGLSVLGLGLRRRR